MTTHTNTAHPPGVFLTTHYPTDKQWLPLGYLTREHVSPTEPPAGRYIFSYLRAAQAKQLPDLWGEKNINWEAPQVFDERLPPPFAWRIRPRSRPDYAAYLQTIELDDAAVQVNPFILLARTEGRRVTDNFETFAKPVAHNGQYNILFFLRGLEHFLTAGHAQFEKIIARVKRLAAKEELFLMLDAQNPFDPQAVAVRTRDHILIGYCPRYLAHAFRPFLGVNGGCPLRLEVQRVNPEAPLSIMLLCRLLCKAPADFKPCSSPGFTILAPQVRQLAAAYDNPERA